MCIATWVVHMMVVKGPDGKKPQNTKINEDS